MLIEKSPKSLVEQLKASFEKEDQVNILLKRKIFALEILLEQNQKKIYEEKIISILLATAWGTTMFLWIFFS